MTDHRFKNNRRGRPSYTDECVVCGVTFADHGATTVAAAAPTKPASAKPASAIATFIVKMHGPNPEDL